MTKPMFIQVSEYEDIKSLFETLKKKYDEAQKLLTEVKTLHQQEEEELNAWEQTFKDADVDLSTLDNVFS